MNNFGYRPRRSRRKLVEKGLALSYHASAKKAVLSEKNYYYLSDRSYNNHSDYCVNTKRGVMFLAAAA